MSCKPLALIALSSTISSVLLVGCVTAPVTHVVAAWKDPNADVVTLGRSLLVFQHKSEALRRTVEDALAARIPGARPAYSLFSTEEIFKEELVRDRMRELGFDTVIITRLVDVDEEVSWSPGAPSHHPYDPLWGYWGYGWSTVHAPAYLDRTTVVTLESRIYSLEVGDGELLWASRSETFDPDSIDELAASVINASTRAMERQGLLVAR